MKKLFSKSLLVAASLMLSTSAFAADYVIDTQGAHSSIQFKVSHLGIGWVNGRFNTFEGSYSFSEENPSDAKVSVTIDPSSVDSNQAERDKHIRSEDFLHVSEFASASFVSTGFDYAGDGKGKLSGDLTLRGVTKPVVIDVTLSGKGDDPWGGYRTGFEGTTSITMADFGIPMNLGPASATVDLYLSVEGIRQ